MTALDKVTDEKTRRDYSGDDFSHCVWCDAVRNDGYAEPHAENCAMVLAHTELAALRKVAEAVRLAIIFLPDEFHLILTKEALHELDKIAKESNNE